MDDDAERQQPAVELRPPPPTPGTPLPPTMGAGQPLGGRAGRKQARRGRPVFGAVVGAAIGVRGLREVAEHVALDRYGWAGVVGLGVLFVAAVLGWRSALGFLMRRKGGRELSRDELRQQLADSGVGGPAFVEDGHLLGASVFAVNQHPRVLELDTAYSIFGSGGAPLGEIRQIGQTTAKRWVRGLTALDQYFTHHFEVDGSDGAVVLRLTRPRKLFLTKVHVFDGADRFLGTIRQENVFGRIGFSLLDPAGTTVGRLQATNLRAWDFTVVDAWNRPIATVVKSWEGWTRTAITRADRYVVKVHYPLPHPLRELTLATALSVDLALKQDARGLG